MATSYEDIYSSFLGRIEDIALAEMTEQEQNQRLLEFFNSAMAYIESDNIKVLHDLTDRDEDLEEFNDDLSNLEKEMIATYMEVAWYTSRLNSLENMTLMIGHKEEKWSDQRHMSNAIKDNRKQAYLRARKLARNFNIHKNSYLDGD